MSDTFQQIPASDSTETAQDIQGMRALLSRLYREIGIAAVAAELNIQQSGPRITRRTASLNDSATAAPTPVRNISRAA